MSGRSLKPWYRAEPGNVARSLSAKMQRIRDNQRPRRQMFKFYAELYGGQEIDQLGLTSYDVGGAPGVYVPPSLPHNVTRSAVETVVARIGKERPLPQVTTDQGDYGAWKRAKRMTQAIEGGFEYLKVFDRTKRSLRDAAVFGSGIVKLWRMGDRPMMDRVFPWEIAVDVADAIYGDPRSFYYQKWYDKGVLQARAKSWGCSSDVLTAIEDARCDGEEYGDFALDKEDVYDRILVTEAWHLPSAPGENDGKHAIIIAGNQNPDGELVGDGWAQEYPPFVVLNYKDPIAGYWGDSLAQEMAGYQIEINIVSERVRAGHYMTGTGIWLVPEGGGPLDTDFDNSVAPIVRYKQGFKPEHVNPDPVNQATYQYLLDMVRMAPQDSGLNEQAMHGQKPTGIIAAKALESIKDETSERLSDISASWDQFHVDIGNRLIDLFCEIAEEHGDFTLKAPTKRGYKQYVWADVSLPRDAFTLKTQATSMLAKTPAGRIQQTYDLFNAKVISRVLFLKLLDAPDVDAETDLECAPSLLIDEQISSMLEADEPDADGVYQAPLPLMDLTYAMHRGLCHWAFAKMRGVPPENLTLILDYIDDCRTMLASASAIDPSQAAGPGLGAPPPTAPMQPGALPAPPAPQGALPPTTQGMLAQ